MSCLWLARSFSSKRPRGPPHEAAPVQESLFAAVAAHPLLCREPQDEPALVG